MTPLKRNAGRATIWTPIMVVLGILGLYLLITYAPIYIEEYRIQQAFAAVGHEASATTLENIRYETGRSMDTINPPFRKEDIRYSNDGTGRITIDVTYQVQVNHPGLEPIILRFNPHTEFRLKAHE